jgi:hypothetical protein
LANWSDLEGRAAALRKELAAIRASISAAGRGPERGGQGQLDQLRQLEVLRAAELLNLEKELANRPY